MSDLPDNFTDWHILTQEYYYYLKAHSYAKSTTPFYANNVQDQLNQLVYQGKIDQCDIDGFTVKGFGKIENDLPSKFQGYTTFSSFLSDVLKRRFWGLGFDSNYEDLKSFQEKNYWQALHYSREDNSSISLRMHAEFDEIKQGDYVIIKGHGGKADLTIHYAGVVKSKDSTTKRLELYPRNIELYKGKAPSGANAGNWHNTIVEVKRPEDIENLFKTKSITRGNMETQVLDTEGTEDILPLNQILYGPPGTGKTYNTINKAVSIAVAIKESDLETQFETRKELKEKFDELLINDWEETKGQIAFTTFHQSMTYEDFVEGIKPDMKGDALHYQVIPGIFKQICSLAKNAWLEHKKGRADMPSFEEAFSRLQTQWEEEPTMEFTMKTKGKEFTIEDISQSSILFKKASGSTTHTLSINTLRDYYYGIRKVRETGVGIYYPGVLEKLNSYHSEVNKTKRLKNYVLVIDEINRGNVSQILGELITLLEKDKRLGEDESLEVILPYSREPFGVPPNLYVIGTMNTADRSVEALDAALRRRFSFKEMAPLYSLEQLDYTFAGHSANRILKVINTRIQKLRDSDHTIGHSYFIMEEENNVQVEEHLLDVFYNKIIPLLQEYFFGEISKIGRILGNGFIKKKDAEDNIGFAPFDGEDDSLERDIYEVIDYRNSSELPVQDANNQPLTFDKAITILMQNA